MATKRRGRCVYTQYDREILCAGTLDSVFMIKKRTSGGTSPGKSIQPKMVFTDVVDSFGRLEVKKSTRRFDGVSIMDQSQDNFTHAGYIPFDQDVYELDVNTLFVDIEDTRNRRFKLKSIEKYNEGSQWLQLKLAETGFADLEASGG